MWYILRYPLLFIASIFLYFLFIIVFIISDIFCLLLVLKSYQSLHKVKYYEGIDVFNLGYIEEYKYKPSYVENCYTNRYSALFRIRFKSIKLWRKKEKNKIQD